MGVYIKGMEIPKESAICVLIFPDGKVTAQFGATLVGTAVTVPPHGRLIDADMCERIDMRPWDAPTIIPASEEEGR